MFPGRYINYRVIHCTLSYNRVSLHYDSFKIVLGASALDYDINQKRIYAARYKVKA